jgi:hypothetical protein
LLEGLVTVLADEKNSFVDVVDLMNGKVKIRELERAKVIKVCGFKVF